MILLKKYLMAIISLGLAFGCTPYMQPPLKPLDAGTSNAAGSGYVSKVDNFQVILDSSLSMDEGKNYFLDARNIVSRINQGVPSDLKYQAGLRSFGHSNYQSKKPTDLLYGMTDYNKAGFHDGLNKIQYTGGPSPLSAALEAAGKDLQGLSGKSALIIVSDGLHMEDSLTAAKAVVSKLGPNTCLYTIAIGNEVNGAGHKQLEKIAAASGCGSATTDKELADPAKMKAFIDQVFVAKAAPQKAAVVAPVAPRDTDGDGVVDADDQCPNTPAGEFVDENGCTLKLTLHVNFDVDSAVIKPESKSDLDKAAAYIQKYAKVPYILIGGHTDHSGTVAYNQTLSEKRAAAVRQALIDNYGVSPARLFARGFGKLQPVADNSTEAGRYQNRRVEIVCCVLKPE
jgi:OOP family OmpA-OmpF porin